MPARDDMGLELSLKYHEDLWEICVKGLGREDLPCLGNLSTGVFHGMTLYYCDWLSHHMKQRRLFLFYTMVSQSVTALLGVRTPLLYLSAIHSILCFCFLPWFLLTYIYILTPPPKFFFLLGIEFSNIWLLSSFASDLGYSSTIDVCLLQP